MKQVLRNAIGTVLVAPPLMLVLNNGASECYEGCQGHVIEEERHHRKDTPFNDEFCWVRQTWGTPFQCSSHLVSPFL